MHGIDIVFLLQADVKAHAALLYLLSLLSLDTPFDPAEACQTLEEIKNAPGHGSSPEQVSDSPLEGSLPEPSHRSLAEEDDFKVSIQGEHCKGGKI